jgi:hypothetical protein
MEQGPNVLIGVRTLGEQPLIADFTHQGSELLRKKSSSAGDIARCFGFDLRVQKLFSECI